MQITRRASVVTALGITQTLAWASSYYLPAMLAAPMAREFGIAVSQVFAAFSGALLVSALLGPAAGRAIDRWGGRPVLMASNGVFGASLLLMAFAPNSAWLFAGWALLGVGLAGGLYEAAFAALVRLYGHDARNSITGITLFAGFASTVGWPLSTLMEAQWGWRGACLGWAALHLLLALPLNALLPRATRRRVAPANSVATADAHIARSAAPPHPGAGTGTASEPRRASILLAVVFAITWFISTAMAAHLPSLLVAAGTSAAAAVAFGALVGPAQVGGRLLEFGLLRKMHPLLSARLAGIAHPIGAALLGLLGAPAAAVFVLLHGAGNGILTIAKGTLPLALFGPAGYGERQGLLMVPARIAQALAPWLFGLGLERFGLGALWVSGGLGLGAFAALMLLRARAET